MWKIGLALFLIGICLIIGSFVFFGSSISKATSERQVANIGLEPGSKHTSEAVTVDPAMAAQVRVNALLRLPDSIVDEAGEMGNVMQFAVPVNYEVYDENDIVVHLGAGELTGSTILPSKSSPHLESFDPEVECTYSSHKFDPPASGKIKVAVEVAPGDGKNHQVVSARLQVHDQMHKTAGRWAVGGLLSMIFGGVFTVIGFVMLVIGFIIWTTRQS